MVAALFVERRGVYFGLPDVDPWDIDRDARLYAGPFPVVAHPPCSSWCQLAYLNQARYGHIVGDDGGCFAAAVAAVRRWGGVLEHPRASHAWAPFNLPRPPRRGWGRGICGGWSCEVNQAAYGHEALKATWLYYVGEAAPPLLDWSAPEPSATCSWLSNNGGVVRRRLKQGRASRTPIAFRNVLLAIASGAKGGR